MRYDTEIDECAVYRENNNRANRVKLNDAVSYSRAKRVVDGSHSMIQTEASHRCRGVRGQTP